MPHQERARAHVAEAEERELDRAEPLEHLAEHLLRKDDVARARTCGIDGGREVTAMRLEPACQLAGDLERVELETLRKAAHHRGHRKLRVPRRAQMADRLAQR